MSNQLRNTVSSPHAASPSLTPVARAIRVSLLSAGMGLIAGTANAASLVVTSNLDNGTNCTLREALSALDLGANSFGCTNASGDAFGTNDRIIFSLGGTITLTSGELEIGSDVVIDASSVSGITVDANQNSRVLSSPGGFAVGLSNLTITGGKSLEVGGGIYGGENSDFVIENSSITNNVGGSFGGGIYIGAYSSLAVTDSQISDNISQQDGGGIYAQYSSDVGAGGEVTGTTLTLTNSTVSGNTALGDEGGGVWSNGYHHVVELNNSSVVNNTAGQQGGGIYSSGEESRLTIVGGSVSDNTSGGESAENDSHGGGIYFYGFGNSSLSISGTSITGNYSRNNGSNGGGVYLYLENSHGNLSNVTISGNSAGGEGGGLTLEEGSLTLTGSTISNNSAGVFNSSSTHGGGMYLGGETVIISQSRITNNRGGYYGGGIFSSSDNISIDKSTISGNSSIGDGGGIYTTGTSLTLTNSTISGNRAGRAGYHEGGGIWSSGGYLDVANSTISGNSAFSRGGGIYSDSGSVLKNTTVSDNVGGEGSGGVHADTSLTLINSIVANSSGGDCSGTVASDAQSIIEDGSCSTAARTGDPGLMPLASNGGLTRTHDLKTGSIAIDTGDNSNCLLLDQRGISRRDGKCDVGAVELFVSGFFVIPTANGKVVVVPE